MAGLVLTLAPREKFFVNGALLENGDKVGRIRVTDSEARILRYSDALHPHEVNTPVKKVYYAVQLLITGDLDPQTTLGAVDMECERLETVFGPCASERISLVRNMIRRRNYYSALMQMRRIFPLEAKLFELYAAVEFEGQSTSGSTNDQPTECYARKVA